MTPEERKLYAGRAAEAHEAMLDRFRKRDGMYKYDQGPSLLRSGAQLWPFGRALAATLDVAGIDPAMTGNSDAGSDIEDHLRILERYWDPAGPQPAYCSDVTGASRRGDRYYDDNAWIGLALVQLERMHPGLGPIERAAQLFEFAAHGWAGQLGGGVFWVEQGRGTGMRNRDRGTVSNAPNAELGLHLSELGRLEARARPATPEDMYRWVLATLDRSRSGDRPGTGLFWDKIRADGTIDRATWSYNQGGMIGASVLFARLRPDERRVYLERAEAIARMERALSEYVIHGPTTNIEFHRWILRHPRFRAGDFDTRFIQQEFRGLPPQGEGPERVALAAAAIAALNGDASRSNGDTATRPVAAASRWRAAARREGLRS